MQASKYLNFLTLACLAALAFFSSPSMACPCMPSHPQTSFCNADYVIRARVIRKIVNEYDNVAGYKLEIQEYYKMTPEGNKILRRGPLLTPLEDNMCGVSLEEGEVYVIAGQGSRLNACNYVKEYEMMSIDEKIAFSEVYRKACSCMVRPFGKIDLKQVESSSGCNWSPSDKRETELSACTPYRIPTNLTNQCRWSRSTYKSVKVIKIVT